jgi:hypothetical protein
MTMPDREWEMVVNEARAIDGAESNSFPCGYETDDRITFGAWRKAVESLTYESMLRQRARAERAEAHRDALLRALERLGSYGGDGCLVHTEKSCAERIRGTYERLKTWPRPSRVLPIP